MGGATRTWQQLCEIPEQSRLLGAGYGALQLQVHFAVYAVIDLRNEEHLRDGHLAMNGQSRPTPRASATQLMWLNQAAIKRYTAFGLHRLEATAPWGLEQEKQTEEKITPSNKKMAAPRPLLQYRCSYSGS
jgi:hypothetical protein